MIKRDTFTKPGKWLCTPKGGQHYTIYKDFLLTNHLLVAGTTGSGKSVVNNGIIATALKFSNPWNHQFIFIDPKQVELDMYKELPLWNKGYTDDIEEAAVLLREACVELDRRMKETKQKHLREYPGTHLHIVIDEYADLVHNAEYPKLRPVIERYVCKIARMGRAARIHLIVATQRSTAQVITGELKVNIDYRLCLRQSNAQESRNVIERTGAELLPKYGYGLYKTPDGIETVTIPYVSEEEIRENIEYWVNWKKTGSIKRA